jgi:enoyl-CoA hydratase/carnithine racemase
VNDPLSYSRDGAIADVLFGDSEHGNLISNDVGDGFAAYLAHLPDDVRLVRLRSDGPTFCTGRVSPMPPPGSRVSGDAIKHDVAAPALRVYEAIRNAPVPVLAVVKGAAHGYGCALVVACDLAIASPDARFRIPEMDRGIPPLLVMTAMNGRVPPKTIAHLALSRDEIDAKEALRAGIVSAVCPAPEIDAYVDALAASIASAPVESVRAIKEFLRVAPGSPFPVASALAANLTGTALAGRFLGPP